MIKSSKGKLTIVGRKECKENKINNITTKDLKEILKRDLPEELANILLELI